MRIVYSIFIGFYGFLIFLSQGFSSKAKLWIQGRKNWKQIIQQIPKTKPIIWIHAASYGEFEQGKPIVDYCFDHFPNHQIVLSFFSPSGFESKKNYSKANHVIYLPLDTISNAKFFIEELKPEIAIFVKYEFWYNLLNQCFKNNIPVVYFSSVFRPNQLFFKFYGKWFLAHLKQCSRIFVRDNISKNLLENVGVTNAEISGDTRFDSVFENSNSVQNFPDIDAFVQDKKVVVFGSTWEEDEAIIVKLINRQVDIKCIIAPHEINSSKIVALQNKFFKSCGIYSKGNFFNNDILIIDKMGMLKHLYAYGTVNYVGGGFGKGIHNLLEAVVFGKNVVFGPNYKKFPEAFELIKIGGGISISNLNELELAFNQSISNPNTQNKSYFLSNLGATKKVSEYIKVQLNKNTSNA